MKFGTINSRLEDLRSIDRAISGFSLSAVSASVIHITNSSTLQNITGGFNGKIITLWPPIAGGVVSIVNTGNISINTDADPGNAYDLYSGGDDKPTYLTLIYDENISRWRELARLGADGYEGDQGETGPIGEQGPVGETGPDSIVEGDAGFTGPDGETGPLGEPGDQGDTGDVGDTGSQGETGVQGEKGPPGTPC